MMEVECGFVVKTEPHLRLKPLFQRRLGAFACKAWASGEPWGALSGCLGVEGVHLQRNRAARLHHHVSPLLLDHE